MPFLITLGIVVFCFLLPCDHLHAGLVEIRNNEEVLSLGKFIDFAEDPSNNIAISSIISDKNGIIFSANEEETPNWGISDSTFWIRIQLKNLSEEEAFILGINSHF